MKEYLLNTAASSVSVSIARRLQNPLVELVKIEPKHLGIGMYQVCLGRKDGAILLLCCIDVTKCLPDATFNQDPN